MSPDGRLVAIGGGSGIVTFLDAASRRPVGEPYRLRDGNVQNLEFSPDGRTLAVAGHEPPTAASSGLVDLVDTRTHERRLASRSRRSPTRSQYVGLSVLYLPDGRDVIVEQIPGPDADGPPSVLRRFDGKTGAAEGPPLRVGRHSSFGMSATADRRRLFVTSAAGRRDRHDRRRARCAALRRWPVGDVVGTVSADGSAVRARLARGRRPRARPALRAGPALRRGATRDPSTRCGSRPTGGRS